MTKYRYIHSCGLFLKSGMYFIEIPSENLFNAKEEAETDNVAAYRFIKNGISDIWLAMFPEGESIEKDGNAILTHLNGDVSKIWNEEEFKAMGGKIFECNRTGDCYYEPGNEVSISWSKLFKGEKSGKLTYVDDEAYSINEVEIEE